MNSLVLNVNIPLKKSFLGILCDLGLPWTSYSFPRSQEKLFIQMPAQILLPVGLQKQLPLGISNTICVHWAQYGTTNTIQQMLIMGKVETGYVLWEKTVSISKSQIKQSDPRELDYLNNTTTHELWEELLLPSGSMWGKALFGFVDRSSASGIPAKIKNGFLLQKL